MVDADSLIESGKAFALAALLDAAMAADAAARADYARIYGVQWSPIGTALVLSETSYLAAGSTVGL